MASLTHSEMLEDIQEKFDNVKSFVNMVAKGKVSPSCLITGSSGVGKTYLVNQTLKNCGMVEGLDYIVVKGHSSPLGLYQILLKHKSKILVFDDCDSIFGDAKSLNLLKAGLDSYDVRKISWLSKSGGDHVASFEFTGKIIFISNLPQSKINKAVKGRTLVVNVELSRKEVLAYIETILPVIEPNISIDIKKEVLAHFKRTDSGIDEINIRTYIKACRIRSCNPINWIKLIQLMD